MVSEIILGNAFLAFSISITSGLMMSVTQILSQGFEKSEEKIYFIVGMSALYVLLMLGTILLVLN